ncbi:MAG TPA: class A beta-lactamase-related serine hydrolase, partial [Leeuwenhoekiella sp.]|nr:class A beta-lactamase-related serine hydrolase [Leeuwenhoekiella sp.]
MNSFAHYLIQGLLIILLGYTAQAQKHELQSVIKKYKPYYNAENTKMGVLIKKNGNFESASVGFENDATKKIFCIGSATKTFTAVLILQEMERGTLKLNDSIGKFLNPIKNIPSNLTVEQLLRHESGIGQTVGGPNVDGYSANNDVLLRQSVYENIEPQDTAKIGVHRYTNTNYILLGEILEKINDAPYDQLLKDRIFKICGMENTYPYVSKNIPHLMHPFTMEGKDIYNKINYKYFKDRVFAAGSIASTLRDMAQFY